MLVQFHENLPDLDARSRSVGRSMSPNFCASFDDLAQCYDHPHHQPQVPQQHQLQMGVMQPMDQQCYQSADQTRNSNPDMLDTYSGGSGGHQNLHFGGEAAAHHQGGGEVVGDMPNGFHALGEIIRSRF